MITKFVDKSLKSLKQNNLMTRPHNNMPIDMIDSSVEQKSDWIPWKAVKSLVTDKEIADLEKNTKLKYPKLYKDFLQYKHFYELEVIAEICFFKHCIRDWKIHLKELYFEYWEPKEMIGKGFIPFADYSDWGIVCFDTNRMVNSDCPIIMFDHETIHHPPVDFEDLYPSFESMIDELLFELKSR